MNDEQPTTSKYKALSAAGRRLARIPRFGRLIAMMPRDRFSRLSSEAATFWELYTFVDTELTEKTGLLDSGLQATGASLLGWRQVDPPEPQPNRNEIAIRHWQRDLALTIISAIAFEIFCGQDGRGETEPIYVVEGDIKVLLNRAFNRVWKAGAYVDECGDPITPKKNLWNEWHRIKQMNAEGLRYLLMSDVGPDEDSEGNGERILFTDISTQAFFAAHWAAHWADEADRAMMMKWFSDPLLDDHESYLEFWRMAAELPDAAIDLTRWQALFAPLYDGRLVHQQNGLVIRCTELIYRTWDGMDGTQAKQAFVGEFAALLNSSEDTSQRRIARGLIWQDGVVDGESSFLSLCQGERGDEDNGRFPTGGDVSATLAGQPIDHYRLHRFCVTNEEFELFWPGHRGLREFEDKVSSVVRHPVVNVSWYDAWCFAQWIGELPVGRELYTVCLPSELQWEYGCRCGETSPFTWSDRLHGDRIESGFCNFNGNYPWPEKTGAKIVNLWRTIAVDGQDGELQVTANPWGLIQMHGNVFEWCEDWCNEDAVFQLNRGGSWFTGGGWCRSAFRSWCSPGDRSSSSGFRLAAVPVETSKSGSERSRRLGDR